MNDNIRPPLTITILGERGAEWERITGTRTFPTLDWNPVRADLPGLGVRDVHRLNLGLMPPDMVEKIVAHLAAKFGMTPEETRDEVMTKGIPVLAEGCSVVLNDPQRWL